MRSVLLLSLVACDDTVFPNQTEAAPIGDAEGWCGVRALFAGSCVGCHSASAAAGALDLETDPHGAVVGVESPGYNQVLVVPGDAAGSLLYAKIEGSQGPLQGGRMPPGVALESDPVKVVRDWIVDGAPDVCDETTVPPNEGYHQDGWAEPALHGTAAKVGVEDCRTCHGPTLEGESEGGVAQACSDCHPADWQTTCTFCHGSGDDPAPPEDIDDNADPATISFPAHRLHLTESLLHGDWDCVQCHVKPESALSPGHLFDDDTPAVADLTFTGGLSPDALFTRDAEDPTQYTCSNLYCHGDGTAANGRISSGDAAPCGSCHQDALGGGTLLSGLHEKHVTGEGFACSECHPTVNGEGEILSSQRERHVDSVPTISLPAGITYTALDHTCLGVCHDQNHSGRSWFD